jgi:hypothetical protein
MPVEAEGTTFAEEIGRKGAAEEQAARRFVSERRNYRSVIRQADREG